MVGWSRVVQLDLDMKDQRTRISNDSRPFASKHQATAAALIVQLQVLLGGYAKPPANGQPDLRTRAALPLLPEFARVITVP